jgi:phage terminase large subunit-like protein
VTVRLDLLPHQWKAMTASEPYVAMVTGLGGGKTWFGARWLMVRALTYPTSIHLATANSYQQLKDAVMPQLFGAAEDFGIDFDWHKRDGDLYIGPQRALIRVRSTENYNMLRGAEFGSWWADEVRDASTDAVNVVLGRMRCRKVDRPRYLWTTTPNGYDHVWKRHVADANPDCRLIRATSRDNTHLSADYFLALETTYSERMLAQELGGEFVTLDGTRAYVGFDRGRHVRPCAIEAGERLALAFDFNVTPLCCVVGQEVAGHLRVVAEHVLDNASVEDMARLLVERYAAHRSGVSIYGDAAGSARNVQTGTTTYAILMQALRPLAPRLDVLASNPRQVDRVNSVNWLFGRDRVAIDPSAKRLIEDLERVKWDDGGSLDKRDAALTHASDALGYWLMRHHGPSAFRAQPRYGMT